jgi:pSer/pThr/pTyr-binding forkhead associated (FHA) protein
MARFQLHLPVRMRLSIRSLHQPHAVAHSPKIGLGDSEAARLRVVLSSVTDLESHQLRTHRRLGVCVGVHRRVTLALPLYGLQNRSYGDLVADVYDLPVSKENAATTPDRGDGGCGGR